MWSVGGVSLRPALAAAYLGDPPDVLVAVLFREAKVLVQAEAYVVAIETVGREALLQQVLLERCGDGRFAGC